MDCPHCWDKFEKVTPVSVSYLPTHLAKFHSDLHAGYKTHLKYKIAVYRKEIRDKAKLKRASAQPTSPAASPEPPAPAETGAADQTSPIGLVRVAPIPAEEFLARMQALFGSAPEDVEQEEMHPLGMELVPSSAPASPSGTRPRCFRHGCCLEGR